jgi:XTP/dITP diphosphohydrolase|tara:strand:+ start:146 stop:754 length:609 start_codon:yes stop_codon:yes gene_type:complete
MNKIVLASSNQGKLREFKQILSAKNFELIPQSTFNFVDADETGLSFVENAIIKARHASELTGLPSLADDSGIEVDALQGRPGIYSARYAQVQGPSVDQDKENNKKLLLELADIPEPLRTARFQCVIVFMRHPQDPTPLICQGSWEGQILSEEAGVNGFGYDPLFFVPSHNCTSAELSKEIKNNLSHRGKALRELMKCWQPLL